ncbi:MAG: hypothetical protein ACRDJ9_03310 [Dehalococcoidia bacterium]
MTDTETRTLVLKNEAGDYFLLRQEVLERGRVPEEHKAEVERLVAEAQGDDVSGHAGFLAGVFTGVLGMGLLMVGVVADGMGYELAGGPIERDNVGNKI